MTTQPNQSIGATEQSENQSVIGIQVSYPQFNFIDDYDNYYAIQIDDNTRITLDKLTDNSAHLAFANDKLQQIDPPYGFEINGMQITNKKLTLYASNNYTITYKNVVIELKPKKVWDIIQ
jgi:hypothetical protein